MIKLNKKLQKLIIIFGLLFFKYLMIMGKIDSLFSNNNYKSNSFKIFNNIKRTLKDLIYKYFNKNITNIDSLYIKGNLRFGNYFISLNNAIIFCEVMSCKKIIIFNHRNNFINDKIFYRKYNITIESNYLLNYFDNNSIIAKVDFFFYKLNFTDFGKVNRFYILRKEILNNLPKVKIKFDSLYIYIRGGDIFRCLNKSVQHYFQPPLCFYKKILNEFVFSKVIIISEDVSNPVIPMLLKEYSYIKYNKNNIKLDISYLANSYFCFNYTIYKMKVHDKYKKLMYPFKNTEKQRKLMIKERCENNNFHIIPPRIS
jgi:hypothetical protein